MSATLLIKNALTVRGDGSEPETGGVLVDTEAGTISACGKSAGDGTFVYDAGGAYLFPAFTDIACRFSDPAHAQRDSIATASAAAVGGGFLNLACLPHQSGEPVTLRPASTPCRILPVIPVSDPSGIDAEKPAVYTDIPSPVTDPGKLKSIMLACRASDSLFIPACLDRGLASDGVMRGGRTAKLLGLAAIPESAFLLPLITALILSAETGCRIHIPAVSDAESVSLVRQAKSRGVPVTCGTSPLYFSMTDNDVFYYGGSAKVIPPLGTRRDRESVCEALSDGTIDCISSLHTPLTKPENCQELKKCLFGASGFDTAFSASVTYLLKKNIVTPDRLAALLAVNPAKITGRKAGITPGAPADLVIADTDAETVVSSNTMKSKSVNTPYLGMTLTGCVKAVFSGGVRVF